MNSLDLVLDNFKVYNLIKPKNWDNTYTVIATLNDYDTGRLLAIATGTQACLKVYDDDIQDCHAESLVKRAYKRYLINTITELISSSSNLNQAKELILKHCSQDLTLFVSQFPCGLVRRYEGAEPIDEATQTAIKRKPGRGTIIDGKTIYVEKDNCTAKLKKWINTGFQGSKLENLFHIRNRIRKLIIGNCEPNENFDYQYWSNYLSKSISPDGSPVEIDLIENIRRDEFVFSQERQPQPVAIVWWSKAPQTQPESLSVDESRASGGNNYEFVVDGRKRGITKRQCLDGNAAFKLKIANHCLRRDLTIIEDSILNMAN